MFGNSNRDKKLKEMEDELQLIKANMKMKFQKLDWANQLIQIKQVKEDFDSLKKSLSNRIETLDRKIQELRKLEAGVESDLPDIPWIKEIIFNPKSEKLQYLPIKQKLKIWGNIFSNIGLINEFDLIEKYPFHFDEDYFEEIDMLEIGMIYLGQLGTGYQSQKQCQFVFNFGDFKIYSDDYKDVIEKIISMGINEFTIHVFKNDYDPNSKEHTITFEVDAEEYTIKINEGKYLDGSLVTKVIKEFIDEVNPMKFYFWLHSNYGSYLLFLNHYQKMIIEKIFHLTKGLKEVEVDN